MIMMMIMMMMMMMMMMMISMMMLTRTKWQVPHGKRVILGRCLVSLKLGSVVLGVAYKNLHELLITNQSAENNTTNKTNR